jgi:hypothetical protein
MIFSLDVRRARKGDCLLLHFGPHDDPGLVMIDGGPSKVYVPQLRPRLVQIRDERVKRNLPGVTGDGSLNVDVAMVSHVDDDHIKGMLDLTGEMLEDKHKARLVQVTSFWHNSFEDLLGKEHTQAVAQFGAASLSGELPPDALENVTDDEERERIVASHQVLASIDQGQKLRGRTNALGWPLNPEFDSKLAIAGEDAFTVADHGLTFRVIGPMQPEIDALREMHDKWVEEQEKTGRKGGAALAAYADKSVPNLSSIVVLAELGGNRILLTGDARGDKILQGLEFSKVIAPNEKLHVDILKVPHHGSSRNVDIDFFKRITADHYVFSGNGEHGNPERETMEMLFEARPDRDFSIHLTYSVTEIDQGRVEDWKTHHSTSWIPDKQDLAAFFKKAAFPNERLLIVDADAKRPHLIDVSERLGY